MRARLFLLVPVALTAAGCASPRPAPVEPCPHCKDPVTTTQPDGFARVMTRLRLDSLPEDPVMPVFAPGASRFVDPGAARGLRPPR